MPMRTHTHTNTFTNYALETLENSEKKNKKPTTDKTVTSAQQHMELEKQEKKRR